MFRRFEEYILEKKLIKRADKVLMAVSGGIDSMVMAQLMIKAGYHTAIAHCNFSLRGKEADLDEQFVKKFAEQQNIIFHSARFNTRAYADEHKISVQMAARELRYQWFEQLRKEKAYDAIAVAHNLNDNIETLLINLVRGTGLSGLKGISYRSGNIIRPLLFATRSEITAYSKAEKIRFREDKSNSETKYTRNKIRHEIIPVLKEINPSVEQTLNEFTSRASELDDLIRSYADSIRSGIITETGNEYHAELSAIKKIISNEALVFEVFKPFNLSGAKINDLKKIISGRSGGWILTPGHRFIRNRQQIIITPSIISVDNTLIINTYSELKNCRIFKEVSIKNSLAGIKLKSDGNTAFIDSDRIKFPLKIRNWRKGDYFYPFGMKRKKKLSDFFIDNKFSLPEKEKALILESENKVVWIIGKRTDNRFRVTASTKKVLVLSLK